MEPLFLFGLASRHAQWSSVRQAAITGNIANANTPGYKAADVEPFSSVLDKTRLSMARTADLHMTPPGASAPSSKVEKGEGWDINHSGNTVRLEEQMLKAGEVNKAFTLNTNIVRSFHRMLLMSVKS